MMMNVCRIATVGAAMSLLLQGCGGSAAPVSNAVPVASSKPDAVVQECTAADLIVGFDGRDGEYSGMSHDGALMVVRNSSSHPCRVSRLPQVAFTTAAGKVVAARMKQPQGMHPGPVLAPITLAPAAAAECSLRWVSGPVYPKSACVDTARASIVLPDGSVSAEMHAHLCGGKGSPLEYEQQWLQPAAKGRP